MKPTGRRKTPPDAIEWQIIDFLPPAFLRYKEEQAATAGMAAAE
jgi:hypothetical protein